MIPFKNLILKFFPNLEFSLIQAGMKEKFDSYIKKILLGVAFFSLIITAFFLFIFLKKEVNLALLIPLFLVLFVFFLFAAMQLPAMAIRKRREEIESDLIYTVRHFLLSMECGNSLINALEDAAGLNTVSAKYFAEVIHDINIGSPTEEAIDYAIKFTPSDHFKQVMNIIKNSLRTGADIKKSIKSNLKEMSQDKILEIKDYGKKLSPLSMFYMIIGTIVPSIGASVFVIGSTFFLSSLAGSNIASLILISFAVLLIIVQLGFYLLFKSMRPLVSA